MVDEEDDGYFHKIRKEKNAALQALALTVQASEATDWERATYGYSTM